MLFLSIFYRQHNMTSQLAKQLLIFSAIIILCSEIIFFYLHHDSLFYLGKEYLWVSPLLFFKSLIKKMLLLNFFGIAKIIFIIFWHATKLLFIKALKTVGIRYGTYFSQQQWQKTSQYVRIIIKKITRLTRAFQRLITSLTRLQFTIVVAAFLPVFILLFLFGIGFRMTRDVMVKKSGEIGMSNVAVRTAKKSRGLIARLKQIDLWLLQKIESVIK